MAATLQINGGEPIPIIGPVNVSWGESESEWTSAASQNWARVTQLMRTYNVSFITSISASPEQLKERDHGSQS